MDTSYLAGLIFFLAFAGMILVHELGHYLACRLFGVEVEEFGFGIPPRAWTFWRLKGYFLTKNGKRIEIPRDFALPFPWAELNGQQVKFTVDRLGEKFNLRTLTVVEEIEDKRPRPDPVSKDEITIGPNGEIATAAQDAPAVKTRTFQFGKTRGALELEETIRETHPGTEFTLNWLPLGGFVRPKGENDPNIAGGLAAANPWKRLGVLIAGPLMNLIMAIVVISAIFSQTGVPSQVRLVEVLEGAPAAQAGLQPGDILLSANGETVTTMDGMRILIRRNLDRPVTVVVERAGQTLEFVVTPLSSRYKEGAMGILMQQEYVTPSNWFATIPASLTACYEQAYEILSLPSQMLRGLLTPEEGRFIGLKGIFDIFNLTVSADVESRQSAAEAPAPTYATLNLIALLSISIGLFNLLPFPALDGGRLAF
ncbi:MAG: site-2 protease family protein, partial [Chloroflexota bacterium]